MVNSTLDHHCHSCKSKFGVVKPDFAVTDRSFSASGAVPPCGGASLSARDNTVLAFTLDKCHMLTHVLRKVMGPL